MKPQKGSIMLETDLNKLKTFKRIYLITGILSIIVGILIFPFLFLGIVLICMSVQTNKRYKQVLEEQQASQRVREKIKDLSDEKIEPEIVPQREEAANRPKVVADDKKPEEPISEEELERLKNMCADIHEEYETLLKKYGKLGKSEDEDFEDVMANKVHILSECYRKLDVIQATVRKHKCYYEIDTYEEMEKIEKKAKTLINAYIKHEREEGFDDDLIDITQFSDDLDFISDYIYDKDEKLNRI